MMKFIVFALLCFIVASRAGTFVTIDSGSGEFRITSERDSRTLASGNFSNTIEKNGWSLLSIRTWNPHTSDPFQDNFMQSFAAGYVEGYLTAPLIRDYWINLVANGALTLDVKGETFFRENHKWIKNLAMSKAFESDVWSQVFLTITQMEGIYAGFQTIYPSTALTMWDIYLINAQLDLEDVQAKFGNSTAKGHCSALFKLGPNNNDILFSHDTWDDYYQMLRVYKIIEIDFWNVTAKKSSFSSYPGMVVSGDDWYILDSGLVVTETSLEIYNQTLYDYYTIKSVPYWLRVTVANRLATSPIDWIRIYGEILKGESYNNQWFVLDLNAFQPYQRMNSSLIYMYEEVPGYSYSADITSKLYDQTYFASYNVPYSKLIFNKSGSALMEKKYGDIYSYDSCPRANIFRKLHSNVSDISSLKIVMRYNDYLNDPYSLLNACYSISARCDLNKNNPFGGLDSKVSNYTLSKQSITHAISGPTNEYLPIFDWKAFPNVTRKGVPDRFDFDFVAFQ
jgi:Phospholipase B